MEFLGIAMVALRHSLSRPLFLKGTTAPGSNDAIRHSFLRLQPPRRIYRKTDAALERPVRRLGTKIATLPFAS